MEKVLTFFLLSAIRRLYKNNGGKPACKQDLILELLLLKSIHSPFFVSFCGDHL